MGHFVFFFFFFWGGGGKLSRVWGFKGLKGVGLQGGKMVCSFQGDLSGDLWGVEGLEWFEAFGVCRG